MRTKKGFSFLLAIVAGILTGSSVSIFLLFLDRVTKLYREVPAFHYTLPFIGIVIAFSYRRFGKGSAAGNALILDTIHKDDAVIPLRMAPFVLVSTLLSHLGGGSVGREGTAVQLGSALSEALARMMDVARPLRRMLVIVGLGAGFAAAFGTPISGAIFGLEVIAVGTLEWRLGIEAFLAAYSATFMTQCLGVEHTRFPVPEFFSWHLSLPILLLVAALFFGIVAQLFVHLAHFLEKIWKEKIVNAELRAFFVGLLLVILFRWEGSGRFEGLGFSEIFHAFILRESIQTPFLKAAFTALTLSGGFKGGEFIPLIFIGATLGSFMAPMLQLPISALAALGLTACFGAVANTPMTASLIVAETFGWRYFPYALLVCFAAYLVTDEQGVYQGQRIHRRKPITLLREWLHHRSYK